MDKGGISLYQFNRWVEFYDVQAKRVKPSYKGTITHDDTPKDPDELWSTFMGKYSSLKVQQ